MNNTSLFRRLVGSFLALWSVGLAWLPAQLPFAPPNDLFAARTILPSEETVRVRQEVFMASAEWGEPHRSSGRSLWWEWTAPRDGWWELIVNPSYDVSGASRPSASLDVFTGTQIDRLVTADNGGWGASTIAHRRLVAAKAGVAYQIAAWCHGGSYEVPDLSWVAFTLQPAVLGSNRTVETRQSLTVVPANYPMEWRGEAWSHAPERDPLPEGDGGPALYGPLWWEWTAPRAGRVQITANQLRVYRGTAIDPSRSVPNSLYSYGGHAYADVAAGETLLIGSGAGTRGEAVQWHIVQVLYEPPAPTTIAPVVLEGLPAQLGPYDAGPAPIIYDSSHPWICPINGWVEFDGRGLAPWRHSLMQGSVMEPGLEVAPNILREGRYYFWSNAGPYQIHAGGNPWPEPYGFTLRAADLPPPVNDTVEQATDLGLTAQAHTRVSLLGATRSLGDPPVPAHERPRPTVWYRWQAPYQNTVGLFAGAMSRSIQVFQGADPVTWSEVPVRYVETNEFHPIHARFSARARQVYYFCLRGYDDDFDVRLLAAEDPAYVSAPNFAHLMEIPWGEFRQTTCDDNPSVDPRGAWFKTTAAAEGWLRFTADWGAPEVWAGPSFYNKQRIEVEGDILPTRAGTTYWFHSKIDVASSGACPCTVRLVFSPAPPAGAVPATAIDLGEIKGAETTLHLFERGAEEIWVKWKAPPGPDAVHLFSLANDFAAFEGGAEGPPMRTFHPDGVTNSARNYRVVAGRTYYFRLRKTVSNGWKGSLTLTTKVIQAASNDRWEQAATLEGLDATAYVAAHDADSLTVQTLSAESQEPLAQADHPAAVHSAWWRWQAPESGLVTVASLATSARYRDRVWHTAERDFAIAVYQGHEVTAAGRVEGLVTPHRDRRVYPTPRGHRLTFRAMEGETYFLQAATPDEFGGLTVSVERADEYERWVFNTPGLDPAEGGPDANPSGDGLPNLLKYTLGLHPAFHLNDDPDRDRAPQYTLAPDGKTWQVRFWSERLDRSYYVNGGAPYYGPCDAAQVRVERSSGFQRWQKIDEVEPLGDNWWRVSLPFDDQQPQQYFRLRARWCPNLPPQ